MSHEIRCIDGGGRIIILIRRYRRLYVLNLGLIHGAFREYVLIEKLGCHPNLGGEISLKLISLKIGGDVRIGLRYMCMLLLSDTRGSLNV